MRKGGTKSTYDTKAIKVCLELTLAPRVEGALLDRLEGLGHVVGGGGVSVASSR